MAIRDEDFDQFAEAWPAWLAAITPTLTARPIAADSFYALTPGCKRLDVIAEPVSALPTSKLAPSSGPYSRNCPHPRPAGHRRSALRWC